MHIGAMAACADGVQLVLFNDLSYREVSLSGRHLGLEPFGLAHQYISTFFFHELAFTFDELQN
jgi:hypothetical protein